MLRINKFIIFVLSIIFVYPSFVLGADMKLDWAKSIGSSSSEGIIKGNKVIDSSGNMYITGFFSETVDFDPGTGTTELVSNGGTDIYLLKLDSNGNFVWVKQIGGSGNDFARSLYIDGLDNLLVGGYFSSTTDFDPGAGTADLTSAGGTDAFVLKLDSNGDYVWAKKMGGTGGDWVWNLFTDSSNNVYSTGTFIGAAVDFDPGAGTTNISAGSSEGAFIQKLDSNGDFVWAKSFSGNTWGNYPEVISVSADGYVYSFGKFRGTTDFNPGAGTANLTSAGVYDTYISKLDSNGNFVWVKQIGGTSNDYAGFMKLDSSSNVYMGISFPGTVDFDPGAGTTELISNGSNDVAIIKISNDGELVWAKQFGGTGSDNIISIDLDVDNNLYISGEYLNTVDFDPGTGTAELTSTGDGDAFLLKLNSSGEFVWVEGFGGTDREEFVGIDVDSSGNVYGWGLFYGSSTDFDINAGTINLPFNGSSETFIIKLTPDSTSPTISDIGASNIQNTSSNIYWSTNENATTQVEYGKTTSYGSTTTEANTTGGTTSHSVSLTDLDACDTYNYRVISKDVVDNSTTSSNYTFNTPGCAAVPVYILQAMSDAIRAQQNNTVVLPPATNNNQTTTVPNNTVTNTKFIFTKNLKYKDNNTDVKELQKFLNNNGYTIATTGPGSINNETNYFGPATRNALIKYQIANNIKPAVGYFGPLTRAMVNK